MAHAVLSRRNTPLSADCRRDAEAILAQLATVQVPGLATVGRHV
jgi:hypothetical protein